MPAITFKAKAETVYNVDDTISYVRVKVPAIGRKHCDMHAFRTHPKYSSYANSDLFPNLLKRALAAAGVGAYIRLDNVPAAATVDTSGFLASVTINV